MTDASSSQKTQTADLMAQTAQTLTIDQALATAYGHWNAGHTNQAELLCQRVLEVWPDNHEALHLLGLMSHNWGNLDLALDYLRKATKSPRAPAVYLSNLAEMCRQKGLHEEGEEAARRAVSMDPTLMGGWNNLGILLQEQGKYQEALICLERVLAVTSSNAEAYNNVGNTHKLMGRLDRALDNYKKALDLSPHYAEAHSNLANLLKEFFYFDEALYEAKKAIEINPRLADAYINAAAIETSRQRYEDALRWLNALLAFVPTHLMGLVNKSRLLSKLDRREEALEVAKYAVIIDPKNGDAHNALALALQGLGLIDEALNAFDIAAQNKCSTPEQSALNKGLLLMEINQPQEALQEFRKAIALNPISVSTYFNLSDLKSFKADDLDLKAMESLLESQSLQSLHDRMILKFALGKAWMDAGNEDARAFDHLHEANKMKRSTLSYSTDATNNFVTLIIENFPKKLFTDRASYGVSSSRPVFVVGMPRSGTTLVEQLLAAHPDIKGAGELALFSRLVNQGQTSDHRPLSYPVDTVSGLLSEAVRIGQTYLKETEKLGQGCKRLVDKMPANFLYAGLIALSLPEARLIHTKRDPLDTCLSCYTKLFTGEQNFSYDLKELGEFYKAYDRLMSHWRSVLPSHQFIEVDYEALVDDLETQAKRLVDFCELPWNASCLDFHKNNEPIRTASVNQVRQVVHKRSVGRWRRYEAYLGPLLNVLDANG